MEGLEAPQPSGYACHICRGVAVVDIDDGYLCAPHAIDALTIDLRSDEPIVTFSSRPSIGANMLTWLDAAHPWPM